MRILLYLISCLCVVSCSGKKTAPTEKLSRFQASLLDTLNKYTDADSLHIIDTTAYFYFVGKCNGVRFGMVAYEDSLQLYYPQRKVWNAPICLDSLPFYHVEYRDINGDNYKDLLIKSLYGGLGNPMYKAILFDPSQNRFRYNASYDLPNIQYIPSNHIIISACVYNFIHCSSIAKYNITPDSLMKAWEVKYCPINEHTTNDSASIEIWLRMNYRQTIGKRETIDLIFQPYQDSLDWYLKQADR